MDIAAIFRAESGRSVATPVRLFANAAEIAFLGERASAARARIGSA